MKIFLSLILSLSFSALYASGGYEKKSRCEYLEGSAKVGWTAFKTAKRVPVKGLLKKVTITPGLGHTLNEIVTGASFEVFGNKGSVSSKNVVRDSKIAKFFFGNFLGGPSIKGKVLRVTDDQIIANMTFNGQSKNIELSYTFKNNTLET